MGLFRQSHLPLATPKGRGLRATEYSVPSSPARYLPSFPQRLLGRGLDHSRTRIRNDTEPPA